MPLVSFLGVIILSWIVVSNGIVMLDYVNQCRERGLSLRDAIYRRVHHAAQAGHRHGRRDPRVSDAAVPTVTR